MLKTSDDLATISMISAEITMIFCLGIVVSHRKMPKVGVVNRLRMRNVQNLVEFPPPLIALHPPLMLYLLPIMLFSNSQNIPGLEFLTSVHMSLNALSIILTCLGSKG